MGGTREGAGARFESFDNVTDVSDAEGAGGAEKNEGVEPAAGAEVVATAEGAVVPKENIGLLVAGTIAGGFGAAVTAVTGALGPNEKAGIVDAA